MGNIVVNEREMAKRTNHEKKMKKKIPEKKKR
jgi:hypothetical protein